MGIKWGGVGGGSDLQIAGLMMVPPFAIAHTLDVNLGMVQKTLNSYSRSMSCMTSICEI